MSMDAFVPCGSCKKILFTQEFEQALRVCPHCGFHHRLSASQRILATFDPNSFEELDKGVRSDNALEFPDYQAKIESARSKTGQTESVLNGRAKIDGVALCVSLSDFSFMGGSMGAAAGEKITLTLERAAERNEPALVFCASGGARMQEGLLSLMQMAKTTAAVERLRRSRNPFLTVFTDPTMAGVLASYASLADVILAEPGALVGFAGARVSKQAGVSKVPDDFQTAEFCLRSGMIDKIVPRKNLRNTLSLLLQLLGGAHGR